MLEPREPQPMAIIPEWIEAHCAVPDGFRAGAPLRLYDEQLRFVGSLYLVRGDARWIPEAPILGQSFVHARAFLVAPQKWGKNPLGAAVICAEAEGPVVFAGWAGRDDGYACADAGCGCGFEYAYQPGEPMGIPWPAPVIQVTAFSEDQTDNTMKVLRPMIRKGPLADVIPNVGESFIRLRAPEDEALIEVVTSSEQSRLGARTTFVLQDQLEQWWRSNGMDRVADAQYRNLAGVGGRAMGLANAWDPTQASVIQREWESGAADVYRQAVFAPAASDDRELDFADPDDRAVVFDAVYPADHRRENGGHLTIESIDAEATKILAYDPPQAERYFGNRIVQGQGRAFDITVFIDRAVKKPRVVEPGALITIGIDGSRLWDHFPVIATEVASGYQWPLGIWRPGGPGLEVPMGEVDAVLTSAFETFAVARVYIDPPYMETWAAQWAGRWGERVIVEWHTSRVRQMAYALRSWRTAQMRDEMSHCAAVDKWCQLFTEHVANAVRRDTGYRDDEGFLWTIEKEREGSPKKIDSAIAATLSWEARNDAIAAGALNVVVDESEPFVFIQ